MSKINVERNKHVFTTPFWSFVKIMVPVFSIFTALDYLAVILQNYNGSGPIHKFLGDSPVIFPSLMIMMYTNIYPVISKSDVHYKFCHIVILIVWV